MVLDGHGNGHGIGLSQWGAYGYAVDHSWTSAQILDHYYGGTVAATVPLSTKIRVRLSNLDNAQTAVSVQTGSLAVEGLTGGGWKSVLVREASPSVYSVWARSDLVRCPAATGDPIASGWTLISASVPTRVRIATVADSSAISDPAQLAAVCEPSGTLRWYRGVVEALNDANGANRTVSELPLEQYLRTVIAMEMSPGWASAGGGRGAQALQAQAVAARSYALSYTWYSYADICDMTCQSYFGVAYQVSGSSLRQVDDLATDAAVVATAGVVRRVGSAAGAIALTMFSASNGGWSAPGSGLLQPFPAVIDEGDDTALNPNHNWTVTLQGTAISAKYAIGTFTGLTVLTRNGYGEWGGRVLTLRLTGTSGSVDVSGAAFRSAMGLKDTWFNVHGSVPVDPCDGRAAPPVTGVAPAVAGARYTPMAPVRLVDTRDGTGTTVGTLGGGCTMVVDPGLAPSVTAVAINLTSVRSATNGFIVAYPCGVERPLASAVQAVAGRVVAGMTIVPLGADGTFCVYSHATTDLVVDLFGTYAVGIGDRYEPMDPTRLYDSRSVTAPLPAGTIVHVKVVAVGKAPAGATAAALTIHSTNATANGFATVYPCSASVPLVASINATKGTGVTNHVESMLSASGEVCVYINVPMHIVVDLSGWFGPAATTDYYAITPVRAVDTRYGTGLSGAFTPNANRAVTLAGTNGLPAASTLRAVMAEVIGVGATSAGYLVVHPCMATVPPLSMVRYVTGVNAATAVAGPDDAAGRWCISASTTVHVVVDISGYFA